MQRALSTIAGHPKCIGLDIVEISPPLDVNDMTANTGAMLALNFLYGIGQRTTGGKTKANRPKKR